MDIDKHQYWILNTLIEAGCNISLLHPKVVQQHFAHGHGLNLAQLVAVLDQLLQAGDIMAEMRPEAKIVMTTRSEIQALFRAGAPDCSIFLTPSGGTRWEEASAPDWNRYIHTDPWGAGWWGATSADYSLVVRYVKTPGVQAHLVSGSEVWEVIEPCEVTYWKTLTVGHKVSFRITELNDDEILPWAEPDMDWYSDFFLK